MIIIKHSWKEQNSQGEGKPKFMLTSNGSYFYNNPNSKFQGLYHPIKNDEHNWTLFKALDHIQLSAEITKLTNYLTHVEVVTDKGTLLFKFDKGVLQIESDYEGDMVFTLDMREVYEYDDQGRVFEFERENRNIVIEYTKYFNSMLENISYTKFLAVKTRYDHEKIMKWRLQHYDEDEKRQSNPADLYVFDAFRLKCSGKDTIKIAFSDDKKDAVNSLNAEVEPKFESLQDESLEVNIAWKGLMDLYVDFANNKGFYAGLPWFFQIWTRDESISMKPLIMMKKYDLAKSILLKRIHSINEKGRLPNRFPYSDLGTADGTGWTFFRIYELISDIKQNEPFEEYISKKDLYYVARQLKKSIRLQRNMTKDYLLRNSALETWMDTSFKGDDREGYRIEIQALWLAMLELSNYLENMLGNKPVYERLLDNTLKEVKKEFFNGDFLKDGKDDSTIRPNIFLAYYLYPDLLKPEEWEKCFDKALEELWLEWGGLATISKSSPLFCKSYTGENNKSYHRGDSWFFINNIAGVCLKNMNQDKYAEHISKIKEASIKDMLYNGVAGRPSELSSASKLSSEASLFQLWSCSTLIELLK